MVAKLPSRRTTRKLPPKDLPRDQEDLVLEILGKLSNEELEVAARADYEYVKNAEADMKMDHAMIMAKRYLQSKKNVEKALAKMKKTIEFREQINIDDLRSNLLDESDANQRVLKDRLSCKKLYVQGYDRDGRATYIFIPRLSRDHDLDWIVKEHVYTLERALACTKSSDKTVNAVIDLDGFSVIRHSPPLYMLKTFLTVFRDHYAGAVNQIFMVNAPSTFRSLWSILKNFIAEHTRNKVHFVKNVHDDVFEPHEAASWMTPVGTKDRELDVDEYLLKTPFDQAFDEEQSNPAETY